MWVAYVLIWKHDRHFGSSRGFYMLLFIPTMMSVGTIPQVICDLWLMSRYGPRLELLPNRWRHVIELATLALWGATGALAFFGFAYLFNGKITFK
jgi:hypothetical protein